jgi:hypothetical protein
MSGIIHFFNQTPIIFFCKNQKTVDTAPYGAEFMVAHQAAQQIIHLRYTLHMMGISLDGPSWKVGNNASVITSSTIPHSALNKRHNALAYHCARECIASTMLYLLLFSG